MKNVVSNIDIGYNIPNLKRLVNVIADVFDIDEEIFIMPLRVKQFDENAYAVKQGEKYFIFVNDSYLKKDKLTDFVIRMFIHEMWHIKQMVEGRLKFNLTQTVATWEGEEYTAYTQHDERAWEIEARAKEREFFKQIKTLLK